MLFKKKITFDQAIFEKIKERDFFLKAFPEYIKRFDKIVIFIHERPDGDCIGGGFGMKEVLKDQFDDKQIYLVGSAEGVFPWLKMDFDELPDDFDFASAMALVVDVAIGDRTQKFKEFFQGLEAKKWGAVIRVDHHEVETEYYTDLAWVDGSYAAASAQLLQICDYYQWPINKTAATYFYLGILTDSSSFSNSEVSPRTLILAAKALRAGADREFLINNLRRVTVTEIKLRSHILANYKQDEKFAWFFLDKKLVKKYAPYSTNNGIVTTLAHIEDNVLWILFTEIKENNIIVNFRSLGNFDVRKLAEEFGGGGHMNASGTTIHSIERIKVVIDRARQLVKEFVEFEGVLSKDKERNELKSQYDESIFPSYKFELDDNEKESIKKSKKVIKKVKKEISSQEEMPNDSDKKMNKS